MGTHKLFANNFLKYADSEMVSLIDEKKFIWGNIKPDYVSKYKLKKHFYNESIDMIIDKIDFLGSMSIEEIYYEYGRKKFSAELGVVCHFLSDYFCFAHSKRWNLKNALKRHVVYEKRLSNTAKNFNFSSFMDTELIIEDMALFIEENLKHYETNHSCENDLIYATFICNSVINTLLSQVVKNVYEEKRAG
jgi:hypothetical protein